MANHALQLTIIRSISITMAVMSSIKFYGALKKDLKHHKPLAKFLAFKLIVGLSFIQGIIFQILRSTGALKESSTMTYADVNFGIDTLTTCVIMVPFSIFFHYAYDVSPYDLNKPRMLPLSEIPPQYGGDGEITPFNQSRHMAEQQEGARYYGGVLGWKAWLRVFDPREIGRAIVFAFTMRAQAQGMSRQVVGVQRGRGGRRY